MYNAAVWLAKVEESTGDTVDIDWQPFLLAKSIAMKERNTKFGNSRDRGRLRQNVDGHQAGLAAKRQGKEAFQSFFITLLKARHEDKVDLNDPAVITEAAQSSGLDLARFREDLADPDLLKELGESHTKAVEEYGALACPHSSSPAVSRRFLKCLSLPMSRQRRCSKV